MVSYIGWNVEFISKKCDLRDGMSFKESATQQPENADLTQIN